MTLVNTETGGIVAVSPEEQTAVRSPAPASITTGRKKRAS